MYETKGTISAIMVEKVPSHDTKGNLGGRTRMDAPEIATRWLSASNITNLTHLSLALTNLFVHVQINPFLVCKI